MNFICLSLLISCFAWWQVSAQPTHRSPLVLNTAFTQRLIRESIRYFNLNSNLLFAQPNPFAYYDLLDFTSELNNGIVYRFSTVLAEVTCPQPEKIPNFASCPNLKNTILNVSFTAVYKPWLPLEEQFLVEVNDVREFSDKRIGLPKYPEFLGFALPNDVENLFKTFKSKQNKLYSADENHSRFKIFKSNLLKIELLNRIDSGSARYGVTEFADLTEEEFRKTHANLKPNSERLHKPNLNIDGFSTKPAPASFDWRTKGAVTGIKNQGMCGSCWAFSATGNIETQWFKKTGKLVSLSEQQLLDCDSKDEACNGGYPEWAYDSIVKMGGLMSENDYPYEAMKESACHLNRQNVSAYINDSATLTSDEGQLAAWLAENGTISVGVNANFLQFYFFGISHPPHMLCPKEGLNHAVLLVGYGTSRFLQRPYWIVKNSWGSWWGERGYFRMYRGDGTCGINSDPTTSIIY